jgi:hypothetical protein
MYYRFRYYSLDRLHTMVCSETVEFLDVLSDVAGYPGPYRAGR